MVTTEDFLAAIGRDRSVWERFNAACGAKDSQILEHIVDTRKKHRLLSQSVAVGAVDELSRNNWNSTDLTGAREPTPPGGEQRDFLSPVGRGAGLKKTIDIDSVALRDVKLPQQDSELKLPLLSNRRAVL